VPSEGGTAKLENALMRGAVLPHLLVDEHIGDRHAARRVGAAGGFKTIGVVLLGEVTAKSRRSHGEVTANALKIDGCEFLAQAQLLGNGLIFGFRGLKSRRLQVRGFAQRGIGRGSGLRFDGLLGIGR
jgi:hypothetical protein